MKDIVLRLQLRSPFSHEVNSKVHVYVTFIILNVTDMILKYFHRRRK
jgi:hypothetical protein